MKQHCISTLQTAVAVTKSAKILINESNGDKNQEYEKLNQIYDELQKISDYYNTHQNSDISAEQLQSHISV